MRLPPPITVARTMARRTTKLFFRSSLLSGSNSSPHPQIRMKPPGLAEDQIELAGEG